MIDFDVLITYLRENEAPVTQTVTLLPSSRLTVHAGDNPALAGRSFGMTVEATRPFIAERAMYFASTPSRLWSGGHANVGSSAPSTSWFHAEGAQGRSSRRSS